MTLVLPDLTVIDRATPYEFTHLRIGIPAEAAAAAETAHLDQHQIQSMLVAVRRAREARGARDVGPLEKFVEVDVGSRFLGAPGDPSPILVRPQALFPGW
jgi:hypothetical protein